MSRTVAFHTFGCKVNQYETEELREQLRLGGYRIVPGEIEFWQGRASRLHDRFLYSRVSEVGWKIERLAP